MSGAGASLKALELSLGEESMKKYLALLRQWYSLSPSLTRVEFEAALRTLFTSEDQFRYHHDIIWNNFLPKYYAVKPKSSPCTVDRGVFEVADPMDYTESINIDIAPPAELEYRSAASELFVPDCNFVKTRLAISSWESKFQIPDDSVAELIVHASRVFVKNIITAMVSRKEGYRIREGKLQYAFGLPVPDPFIRNSSRFQEARRDPEDPNFIPPSKLSVDAAEHHAAFLYSCGKKRVSDKKLTIRLLYDTLKDNPQAVGLHSINSLNLLKVSMILDEE